MTQFIEKYWVDELRKLYEGGIKEIGDLDGDIVKLTDPREKRIFYWLKMLHFRTQLSIIQIGATQQSVNRIGDVLDKLPQKTEFDVVRNDLESAKKQFTMLLSQ